MDYNSLGWLMQVALDDSSKDSQPSATDVLGCISDSKALSLFKAVAISDNDHNNRIFITQLGLNRRQYYSNMEKLMRVGLVRRIRGKHSLTSLGKVVFSCILKIKAAIKYYWKLKAIDSIVNVMSIDNGKLPAEEYEAIINNIIEDDEIKNIFGLNINKNDNRSTCTTFDTQYIKRYGG
jgi:hypothetical protein